MNTHGILRPDGKATSPRGFHEAAPSVELHRAERGLDLDRGRAA